MDETNIAKFFRRIRTTDEILDALEVVVTQDDVKLDDEGNVTFMQDGVKKYFDPSTGKVYGDTTSDTEGKIPTEKVEA